MNIPLFQYGYTDFGSSGIPEAGIIAAFAAYMFVMVIIGLVGYIYMALALMTVAKKTNTKNPWLAWIPVGNLVLMSNIAKKPWWPILLLLAFIIPVLNVIAMMVFFVFVMIWTWKICEARNRPGWWALLVLLPGVGGLWSIIMWGLLAWADKKK